MSTFRGERSLLVVLPRIMHSEAESVSVRFKVRICWISSRSHFFLSLFVIKFYFHFSITFSFKTEAQGVGQFRFGSVSYSHSFFVSL